MVYCRCSQTCVPWEPYRSSLSWYLSQLQSIRLCQAERFGKHRDTTVVGRRWASRSLLRGPRPWSAHPSRSSHGFARSVRVMHRNENAGRPLHPPGGAVQVETRPPPAGLIPLGTACQTAHTLHAGGCLYLGLCGPAVYPWPARWWRRPSSFAFPMRERESIMAPKAIWMVSVLGLLFLDGCAGATSKGSAPVHPLQPIPLASCLPMAHPKDQGPGATLRIFHLIATAGKNRPITITSQGPWGPSGIVTFYLLQNPSNVAPLPWGSKPGLKTCLRHHAPPLGRTMIIHGHFQWTGVLPVTSSHGSAITVVAVLGNETYYDVESNTWH